MATSQKQTNWLKKLYVIPVVRDRYGAHHVVVVFTDPNGNRYVWATTTDSSAYTLSTKNFVEVTYQEVRILPEGDLEINRVKQV